MQKFTLWNFFDLFLTWGVIYHCNHGTIWLPYDISRSECPLFFFKYFFEWHSQLWTIRLTTRYKTCFHLHQGQLQVRLELFDFYSTFFPFLGKVFIRDETIFVICTTFNSIFSGNNEWSIEICKFLISKKIKLRRFYNLRPSLIQIIKF